MDKTLKDVGEFGFIEKVEGTISEGHEFLGDDAAVIPLNYMTDLLATTDILIENIHFDLELIDAVRLGEKALAVNLSDIAAMGGKPNHCLLGMGMKGDTPLELVLKIVEGINGAAKKYGVKVVGGDTVASSELVLAITVIGSVTAGKAVRRSGAKLDDVILVTGKIGDSAAGLDLLTTGNHALKKVYRKLVDKHLLPAPRIVEGSLAAENGANAMIDISDGLLADLGHICKMSSVGAELDLAAIPLSLDLVRCARELKLDPVEIALSGGEDYELIITAPPEKEERIVEAISDRTSTEVTRIGRINQSREIKFSGKDCEKGFGRGYEHFI